MYATSSNQGLEDGQRHRQPEKTGFYFPY